MANARKKELKNKKMPVSFRQMTRLSKFLSLVLRHKPSLLGLKLDKNGWVLIDDLIPKAKAAKINLTRELLMEVVNKNDKERFAVNEDVTRIRANQGHSIDVDLGLQPVNPPRILYHGTAARFVDSIRKSGLNSGNRRYVHLSPDWQTAIKVGQRHGKPVVLQIDAEAMNRSGLHFFISKNGVWLTQSVPSKFILFPDTANSCQSRG